MLTVSFGVSCGCPSIQATRQHNRSMDPLLSALRGALKAPLPLSRQRNLLLLGAGGVLGAAVLAEALVVGRFARVQAVVERPLESALRGLTPLPRAELASTRSVVVSDCTAVLVFERQRHSNGRDAAFVRPEVSDLLPWARSLRGQGVTRLIVVVPHAPALLPHALRYGLATLDEAAVQALGFEHLLFLRAAQHAGPLRTGSPLQRLAGWWLSQLRWMVPQQEQPLRAAQLAACVVALAQGLVDTVPATRVLATDALRTGNAADAAAQWLHAPGLPRGEPTPPP